MSDKAAPFLASFFYWGNAIRRSNEIKGIEIDERNTLKLTQYADDTSVFLRDVQSLKKLI